MNTLDKYENIEYLGKGAFGVVKLYRDKRTKEKVAIKIINKKKITNKYYEAVVKRELSILQNIQHINIINTKQILNDSENIYIISYIWILIIIIFFNNIIYIIIRLIHFISIEILFLIYYYLFL